MTETKCRLCGETGETVVSKNGRSLCRDGIACIARFAKAKAGR